MDLIPPAPASPNKEPNCLRRCRVSPCLIEASPRPPDEKMDETMTSCMQPGQLLWNRANFDETALWINHCNLLGLQAPWRALEHLEHVTPIYAPCPTSNWWCLKQHETTWNNWINRTSKPSPVEGVLRWWSWENLMASFLRDLGSTKVLVQDVSAESADSKVGLSLFWLNLSTHRSLTNFR